MGLIENIGNKTYNLSASNSLDENIGNKTYNLSALNSLDENTENRTHNTSGSNSLDQDIVDKAHNSSALSFSSGDSILPISFLLIVTSIVILATCFLCMQLVDKATTQINWQVSVEPLGPGDKVEIQVEGFTGNPTVAEKQLQTSFQAGEPSEDGINYVY